MHVEVPVKPLLVSIIEELGDSCFCPCYWTYSCSLRKRSDKYYPLSSNTPLKKAIPTQPIACNSKRSKTGFLNPTTILHPLLMMGKKIVFYHLYYSMMLKGQLHPLGQVLNQSAKHLGTSRIQTLIYMGGAFILNIAASTFRIVSTFMSVVYLHVGATEFRHMCQCHTTLRGRLVGRKLGLLGEVQTNPGELREGRSRSGENRGRSLLLKHSRLDCIVFSFARRKQLLLFLLQFLRGKFLGVTGQFLLGCNKTLAAITDLSSLSC